MTTKIFIVAAPSGGGKSSLCKKALQNFAKLVDTVSYTTRQPRAGEVAGRAYHFVQEEDFKERIAGGFFVEWAQVHSNYYGTPKDQINEAEQNGLSVIMDVDVQGARSIKKLYPQAVTIFILPPSLEELKRRIIKRDEGRTQNLDLRLSNAEAEIASKDWFQYQIVNVDLEQAYGELEKILEKELQQG